MAKVKTTKMDIWHWDLDIMLEIQSAIQEKNNKEELVYIIVPLEKNSITDQALPLWQVKTKLKWSSDATERISRIYDCEKNDHNKITLVVREELIMRDFPKEEGKE